MRSVMPGKATASASDGFPLSCVISAIHTHLSGLFCNTMRVRQGTHLGIEEGLRAQFKCPLARKQLPLLSLTWIHRCPSESSGNFPESLVGCHEKHQPYSQANLGWNWASDTPQLEDIALVSSPFLSVSIVSRMGLILCSS